MLTWFLLHYRCWFDYVLCKFVIIVITSVVQIVIRIKSIDWFFSFIHCSIPFENQFLVFVPQENVPNQPATQRPEVPKPQLANPKMSSHLPVNDSANSVRKIQPNQNSLLRPITQNPPSKPVQQIPKKPLTTYTSNASQPVLHPGSNQVPNSQPQNSTLKPVIQPQIAVAQNTVPAKSPATKYVQCQCENFCLFLCLVGMKLKPNLFFASQSSRSYH